MKRELKVMLLRLGRLGAVDRKAHPDEKGTESLCIPESTSF